MLLTGANILLIEHEQRIIDSLKQAVGANYTLDIETRAVTGLKKATLKEYDLYFIDCRLPDNPGLEVLSEILRIYPEAICVMIDEDPDIDIIMRSAHIGGYDFLKKPLRNDKLERLIPRALERRWYIQEARRLKEEKEKSLTAIAEEQSRLRSVIDSIDDGLMIVNQLRETIFHNPRFHSLVGIQRDIAGGEYIFDLLPRKLQKQISSVLDNPNSSCSIKEEIVIEPPAKLVILANTTPILDDRGNLLGAVSVLRDVSEQKALELSKSEFINMVAHELKAPLGAIKSYLEMIINKDLGENQDMYDQYLRRTLERSNAMLALLQDLLNIFRMEAKTLRREIERFDAGVLLEETIDFFQSNIQERGISMETEIQEKLFIRADREEIRRVYTNLLSNAIKYNKENGVIRIRACSSDSRAVFEFEDTGIGIKDEDISRLYEEFFRAKNRYTRNISGTGLGMTILKKIVDEYGGTISIRSEFEKGSTFTVTFPLADI
ncbi:MAG: ATP-binding protein [Candidatus Neomarinimicrobiota bacterium]|jgi:PAS domain S-box-containing protein|nr:ATP-binding protein [Candidatus Neomarinimicrobiota bacterium]MDX9780771.1 ATP-binding protein [bacterium]